MSNSSWHHAAVAVSALAGDDPKVLRDGLERALLQGVEARLAHLASPRDSVARARRLVAERLRATRPPRSGASPPARSARVVALWMLGCEGALRRALASALAPSLRDRVRDAAPFARARVDLAPEVARWGAVALRALGRLPEAAEWDELVAELAGEAPARSSGALRVERALRVAGGRATAERAARAIVEAP